MCYAVVFLEPFIEKMCQSRVWMRAWGRQASQRMWAGGQVSKSGCWWKEHFGPLMKHVLPEQLAMKLEFLCEVEQVNPYICNFDQASNSNCS